MRHDRASCCLQHGVAIDHPTTLIADDAPHLRDYFAWLREQLDERQFRQIHHSAIVAAKFVEATRTDFRARLMVKLRGRTEQLVVSRNYVDQFKQM